MNTTALQKVREALEWIPKSHIGGSVKDAFDRLFKYLDYVRNDAPRNAVDPYQVGAVTSYSFEDLRRIADEIRTLDLISQPQSEAGDKMICGHCGEHQLFKFSVETIHNKGGRNPAGMCCPYCDFWLTKCELSAMQAEKGVA